MINLTEKELNYCLTTFKKVLDDRDNYKENDDYRIHLDSLDDDLIEETRDLLDMNLSLKEVNGDSIINDRVISNIYWLEAMWIYVEHDFTIDEIKKIIDNEECYSIYQKIMGKNPKEVN